jgi:glyoxylase-like metal-dependent hydrolase (beta-lactamase superfamily II)
VPRQGGHPVLELTVSDVKPNAAVAIEVPAAVRGAAAPEIKVESQKLGDGVWYIAGGSHHSVLVEFRDHLVVVEGPQSDARATAVIAEVKRLVPGKSIRYVVNSHVHFDHSSGLRPVVAEGARVVTASVNKPFFEKALNSPHTINPDAMSKSGKKAVVEGVDGKRVLSDGSRTVELHLVKDNPHNDGLLMVYIPKEKILIEADIFTPPAPNTPPPATPAPMTVNLYENVQRLKLDVVTIAPLHGRVVPATELSKAVGRTGS